MKMFLLLICYGGVAKSVSQQNGNTSDGNCPPLI